MQVEDSPELKQLKIALDQFRAKADELTEALKPFSEQMTRLGVNLDGLAAKVTASNAIIAIANKSRSK